MPAVPLTQELVVIDVQWLGGAIWIELIDSAAWVHLVPRASLVGFPGAQQAYLEWLMAGEDVATEEPL